MSERILFFDAERSVPRLSRGWRTPDPSPTRDAVGLPRCAPSQLTIGSQDDDNTPTPRGRHNLKGGQKTSRTPSPVAIQQRVHDDPSGYKYELTTDPPKMPPGTLLRSAKSANKINQVRNDTLQLDAISEASNDDLCSPCAPSVGSIGHPHTCADACKYTSKKKGCKDGSMCDHCHLCIWKPTRSKKGGKQKSGTMP
jgi:hypothetical protein